jgi:hypothetical protein
MTGGSVFDWVDSLIGPDGLLLVVCPALPCLAPQSILQSQFQFYFDGWSWKKVK